MRSSRAALLAAALLPLLAGRAAAFGMGWQGPCESFGGLSDAGWSVRLDTVRTDPGQVSTFCYALEAPPAGASRAVGVDYVVIGVCEDLLRAVVGSEPAGEAVLDDPTGLAGFRFVVSRDAEAGDSLCLSFDAGAAVELGNSSHVTAADRDAAHCMAARVQGPACPGQCEGLCLGGTLDHDCGCACPVHRRPAVDDSVCMCDAASVPCERGFVNPQTCACECAVEPWSVPDARGEACACNASAVPCKHGEVDPDTCECGCPAGPRAVLAPLPGAADAAGAPLFERELLRLGGECLCDAARLECAAGREVDEADPACGCACSAHDYCRGDGLEWDAGVCACRCAAAGPGAVPARCAARQVLDPETCECAAEPAASARLLEVPAADAQGHTTFCWEVQAASLPPGGGAGDEFGNEAVAVARWTLGVCDALVDALVGSEPGAEPADDEAGGLVFVSPLPYGGRATLCATFDAEQELGTDGGATPFAAAGARSLVEGPRCPGVCGDVPCAGGELNHDCECVCPLQHEAEAGVCVCTGEGC